jgi:hypothetical protein
MKRILVGMMMLVVFNAQSQFVNRDHCPNFTVRHQKSGMHYELKKYKPKRLPREGIVIFAGAYAASDLKGYGVSGRVQMVEYGFSGGWDARTTNPHMLGKASEELNQYAYATVFGATLGKYFLIGKKEPRGILDIGMGYGHSAHAPEANKIPVFGYGLASYRIYRDIWLSGSIHATDFQSNPRFSIGLATLVW